MVHETEHTIEKIGLPGKTLRVDLVDQWGMQGSMMEGIDSSLGGANGHIKAFQSPNSHS